MRSKVVIEESPVTLSVENGNIRLVVSDTTTSVSISDFGPQGIQGPQGVDGGNLRYDFTIGNAVSLTPQISDSMIHVGSTISTELASTGERVLVDHVVTEGNVVFSFTEAPALNEIRVWVS